MPDDRDDSSCQMEFLRERQFHAWEDGKPLFVEALVADVSPELTQNELMELIYAEIMLRAEHGEICKPEEYLRRFPENADRLERLFEIHEFFVINETDPRQTSETSTMFFVNSLSRSDGSIRDHDSSPTLTDNFAGGENSPGAATDGLRIPERVGRYRIMRTLGEGGFGIVFLGYDEQLTRPVAVKVPHNGLISCQEDLNAYLTEARTVANLDQPNIVPVYDVGSTAEFPCYIVSKFIEGSDLSRRLKESRLPIETTVDLVATIAEALYFAHQQGLVHRDVKPGNILLDKSDHAFLVDFGMALRETDAVSGASFAGTPAYMSPEQARGEGHRVDCRSDIFSLGAVLYEMLTGARPFLGKTIDDILKQVTEVEARPPRHVDENIPKEVERICLKALSKRAAERFPTAKEMADDLRHFLNRHATTVIEGRSLSPLTSISQTLENLNDSNSSMSATSRGHLIKVVPKGLRSFDAHDANFFLELLPGPRDRDGLPDTLRFWKTRLEETNSDETFSVGLIYGPSGCGKSSLVKAGLLPRLSINVIAVYVEATSDDTETRLLNGLRKRCPVLSDKMSLKETLVALRFGKGRPSETKIVIVLDQFEQWLHAWTDDQNCELVQALRQCDGGRVQCLVMVRDDFWMAATRFMRALEIPLIEGKNSAAVDLFYADHAKKVLAAFGRAFGKLPESARETRKEQKQFLDRAITELSRDGKVISVRLALFAEMMKGKEWTSSSLINVGGAEGVGRTFLEETFSSATAPPEHRHHQMAARGALKALLPELDTEIKGHMRSSAELKEAAEYGNRDKDFGELIRILDNEIRLITPTDPEGNERPYGAATPIIPGQKYYQLTHDYLVPSLRDWLTHEQKQSRQGRAELMLADRATVWNSRQEHRQLPSYWQWLSIRWLIPKRRWTELQQKMMTNANWYYARMQAGSALLLTVSLVCLMYWFAGTVVDQLYNAKTAAVPSIIERMTGVQKWMDYWRLRNRYKELTLDETKKRLNVTLALVSLAPDQPEPVDDLFKQLLKAEPDELLMTKTVLDTYKFTLGNNPTVRSDFWKIVKTPKYGDQRLRAAALLANFDSDSSDWEQTLVVDDKTVPAVIVDELVAVNPPDLKTWIELFRCVKEKLINSLKTVYGDAPKGPKRSLATYILDDFVQNDPSDLAELLMTADEMQFSVIYPTFAKAEDQGKGVDVLQEAINKAVKLIESDVPNSDSDREVLAKKAANAAVVLLRTEKSESVWPLLKHRLDPRIRSYLIHSFKPLGAHPEVLWKQFLVQPEISIRRALLMSLGEFDKNTVSMRLEESDEQSNPKHNFDAILAKLKSLYKVDADPGLHAAVEWLLRKWGEEEWLKATNLKLSGTEAENPKLQQINQVLKEGHELKKLHWYVNGQNQTMVVIPCPVTFLMGSGEGELLFAKDESFHRRTIEKTFAVAATHVTVQQFRRSDVSYPYDEIDNKPGYNDPEQPVVGVTWSQAAAYCNWLSEEEGIPQDQWCYRVTVFKELNDDGEVSTETTATLNSNYARCSGYRLPTEAEWEYAARAGARTDRFFGQTEELMTKYAMVRENSEGIPGKVGRQKPNDFGLFDMLGNEWVWCQELYCEKGPKGNANEIIEFPIGKRNPNAFDKVEASKNLGVLRGGAHGSGASLIRISERQSDVRVASKSFYGFRVARYMPSSDN